MMEAMGIPTGFDTAKNKEKEDTVNGAVRIKTARMARQYMNRKCGFNKPLSAEKTKFKAPKRELPM